MFSLWNTPDNQAQEKHVWRLWVHPSRFLQLELHFAMIHLTKFSMAARSAHERTNVSPGSTTLPVPPFIKVIIHPKKVKRSLSSRTIGWIINHSFIDVWSSSQTKTQKMFGQYYARTETIISKWTLNPCRLVVYLPLWKIWKPVGVIIPNIWKIKFMFQTTNQYIIQWVYPLLIPIIQPPTTNQPGLNWISSRKSSWMATKMMVPGHRSGIWPDKQGEQKQLQTDK